MSENEREPENIELQPFDSLTHDEKVAFSRLAMFGENDEAFPDYDEWRMIVD